jgi:hypothetical protein
MQLKLSVQALNALMLALQKCIAEEKDIIPILDTWNWDIFDSEGYRVGMDEDNLSSEEKDNIYTLWVQNPPVATVLNFDEDELANVQVETL